MLQIFKAFKFRFSLDWDNLNRGFFGRIIGILGSSEFLRR